MANKLFALSLLAGIGVMATIVPSAIAQTPSSADLLKDPQSEDSLNKLFNNRDSSANTSSLLQLIQRFSQSSIDPATLGDNLNDEAKAFKEAQRRRLQQTQQSQVAPQPTLPQSVTLPVRR
jgi:hypothetical protein